MTEIKCVRDKDDPPMMLPCRYKKIDGTCSRAKITISMQWDDDAWRDVMWCENYRPKVKP